MSRAEVSTLRWALTRVLWGLLLGILMYAAYIAVAMWS